MAKELFIRLLSVGVCGLYFFYRKYYSRGFFLLFLFLFSILLMSISFQLQGLASYGLLFFSILLLLSVFSYNLLSIIVGVQENQFNSCRNSSCEDFLKEAMICFLKRDYIKMNEIMKQLWKENKRDPEILYQYAKSLYFLGETYRARLILDRYRYLKDNRWTVYTQRMIERC